MAYTAPLQPGQSAFNPIGNPGQFAAIQSGANSNSLVSQLMKGKPNAVPAASNVASPNQPSNAGQAALLMQALPNSLPQTPTTTAPIAQGLSINQSGSLLQPPTNQPVASHTVTDAQGNTITQKYVPPAPTETDVVDNSGGTSNPNFNYTNPTTPGGTGAGTPVNSNTPAPATFPGLIGSLAGGTTPASANISQDRQNVQSDKNALFAQQKQEAQQLGAIGNSPIPIEFQQGRAAVVQGQEAAVQQAQSNTLAADTAQLGQDTTGQGQQLGALGTAASAAAPIQAPYSNQVLDPQTGQPVNPASSAAMTSAVAQQVADIQQSGKSTAQALSDLSAYGQPAVDALNKALGTNFNFNANAGAASGAASAAATPGAINSQQQTQVAGYQSALQQGQNLQSQLTDLITTFGLNPSDANAVNQGLQKIALNTSDPHYQQLSNYVNDIANTYAQILTPTGGSQTDTTRSIASSMLDATAKGTSLIDVMKGLDQQAQAKIAGVPTSPTSAPQEGSSISAGGYTFKVVNGQYVAQ